MAKRVKRYEEIRDAVKEKIVRGEWQVGYKLPREVDLCRSFDASRTTVRRALSELTAAGNLRRVKGTGTFVSRPQILERSTLFLQSFAEELRSRGLTPVTELLEGRILPACDAAVAAGLGVSEGARVCKVRRLRYSKEEGERGASVLTASYFPPDIGESLLDCDLEHESLYHALSLRGIRRVRSVKTIAVARLPARDCRLLLADEDAVFFRVTTKSYDASGRQIEYCESFYPADRNVFTLELRQE